MKIKFTPDKTITLFIRIKGSKGIRELRAVLDTGSEYSVIPVTDARALGYNAYYDPLTEPGEGTCALMQGGILEVDELELEEVSVGDLVAKNVKALVYELPRFGGVEAVLGMSFLKNFKTTIDSRAGYVTIEPA